MFVKPDVLRESDALLRNSERNYRSGRFDLSLALFFAVIGVLLIGLVIADLPLINGAPINDIDEQLIPILLIGGALSFILVLIFTFVGFRMLRIAYLDLLNRSENYRQAPNMIANVH